MRSYGTKWGERLIRPGGVVLFGGKRYRVDPIQRTPQPMASNAEAYQNDPPYDGRMDGQRGLFYQHGPSLHCTLKDCIWLHTCPPMSRTEEDDPPQMNVMANGYIVWERWREIAGSQP